MPATTLPRAPFPPRFPADRPVPPLAETALHLLARWGAVTREQAARHLHPATPSDVSAALQELTAQGLACAVALPWPGGGILAFTPTTAGWRHLPPGLPAQRFRHSRAAVLLTAVDCALQAEGAGEGRWLTWPEAVGAGLARGSGSAQQADGVLLPPGAQAPVAVCILARRPSREALHVRLQRARAAVGTQAARVYAPASCLGPLAAQTRAAQAEVRPWPGERRAEPPGPPLTTKRLQVLLFLARFGYATVDQVAAAQGTHSTAASIMLAALSRDGLAQRYRQHHLHKDVFSATAAGLHAARSDLGGVPRAPLQRRHALALVDLAAALRAETGGDWLTDRELPGRFATAETLRDLPVPDGVLCLPDGRRVAVELELTPQARHSVLAFVAAQAAAGYCQETWYVVSPECERRYRTRLAGVSAASVRCWVPPDRLGGPRGFRASRSRS